MDWDLVGTPILGVHVDYTPSNRVHRRVGVRVPTGDGFILLNHSYLIWIPKMRMFGILPL